MKIKYLRRHPVEDGANRVTELSGLSADEKGRLWLVSDNQNKLFLLDDNFQVAKSIKLKIKDLEGVGVGPAGLIGTVAEEGHFITLKRRSGKVTKKWDLSPWIPGKPKKKGIEGLCWNGLCWVAVTEKPRKLIAIESAGIFELCNLESIAGMEPDADCSGITWDGKRNCYWIVSHEAASVFALDLNRRHVRKHLRLKYRKKGKSKPVPQAEGIAIIGDRMIIACDSTAYCYEYRLID